MIVIRQSGRFRIKSPPRIRAASARRPRKFAPLPRLEALEDRTLLAGSLGGVLFNDLSGEGTRDAGEPGVSGVRAFLDLNRNGTFDTSPASFNPTSLALENAPGGTTSKIASLNVSGLAAAISRVTVQVDLEKTAGGTVEVGLIGPLYDGATINTGPTLFFLSAGQRFNGTIDEQASAAISLANYPTTGALAGTFRPEQSFSAPHAHIYEGSPNGRWALIFLGDTTGLNLRSWSVTFSVPEPNVVTDAAGGYTFTGLTAGTYDVRTTLPAAATLTSPANGVRVVNVADGADVRGVDFGLRPAADLAGVSFAIETASPAWGGDVAVRYTVTNRGGADAGPFKADLVLSGNGTIDAADGVLQSLSFGRLARGASTSGVATVRLPATPPAGFPAGFDRVYLGLRIDPTGAVTEENEANNANRGAGIDLAPLAAPVNVAVASGTGVQQMPSIAVDPRDPDHLVVAYMDNGLLTTGFAGIGVAVSTDGGATWKRSSIALPSDFSEAAGHPVVRFDDAGRVFVTFMAAKFFGPKPGLIYDTATSTDPGSTTQLSNRRFGFQANNSILVARSDDGGNTFNGAVAIDPHLYTGQKVVFDTLPDLAVDTFAKLPNGQANPNHGNLYATWTRFYPPGLFPGQPTANAGTDIMVAVSADAGQTWTVRTQQQNGIAVSAVKDPNVGNNATGNTGGGFSTISRLAVGPEGDLYVSMFAGGGFALFRSTDAGATFRTPDDAPGVRSSHGLPYGKFVATRPLVPSPTLETNSFRVQSVRAILADPARPGRVYAVENIQVLNAAGTQVRDRADIFLAWSDDYGQTWQTTPQVGNSVSNRSEIPNRDLAWFRTPLNDDNDGRFLPHDTTLGDEVRAGQALPQVSIDAAGNLAVIWYDTRRDPSNHALDVYGTSSTDGGQTFAANYRVTDRSFDANAGRFTDARGAGNFYLGDLIGLATADGMAFAVWTDTRGGNQDLYFTRYSLTAAPAPPGNDRYEVNDTAAAATNLGSVSAARFFPRLTLTSGDQDWFQLTTIATGELIVSATATAAGVAPRVELWDATGTVRLATGVDVLDESGQVVGQRIAAPANSNQTFLVRVSGSPVSSYTLFAQALTADFGTRVAASADGSVAAAGQAVYRVQAAVTGSLEVKLTSLADVSGNLNLSVLSSDGLTRLATGQVTKAAPGEIESVVLPVTAGQTFLILVAGTTATARGSIKLDVINRDQYQTSQVASLFLPTSGLPSDVEMADLDGDKKLDLVVSSTQFSDPISVFEGNGDGTFQAARQYAVGAGLNAGGIVRELVVGDFSGDKLPDVVVTNYASADVSLLVGRGDGTLLPQRRFNATTRPDSLASGDFDRDGNLDLVVLERAPKSSSLAVLLGRGDGTVQPPREIEGTSEILSFPVRVGDFDNDGNLDLVVFAINEGTFRVFRGDGKGGFAAGGSFSVGEVLFDAQVADLDKDGKLDVIATGGNSGSVYLLLGKGDGSFEDSRGVLASPPLAGDNTAVVGLAVVDFATVTAQGLTVVGTADGRLDLVVTARSRTGAAPAQVILLPGVFQRGASGTLTTLFAGPRVLAEGTVAGKVAAGDLNGDGAMDLAVTDVGGVRTIYGKPLNFTPNTTLDKARDLGTVVHAVLPTQAIVPGFADAYFKLTVPTEAAAGAGDQVIDFSALFEHTEGAGLRMEVLDASGKLLATGERLQVTARQGAQLFVHVFGVRNNAGAGSGAYTLVIDVLPQIVAARSDYLLPGAGGVAGGPSNTLVLILQGDQLDPTTAEDASNYTVTWLGADGKEGTADDKVLSLATSASGQKPVVYNPGANTRISSGLTYLNQARQTVTLVFDDVLPVGSYKIEVSSAVKSAAFNDAEAGLLVGGEAFRGHSIVTLSVNGVVEGGTKAAPNLVVEPAPATDLDTFTRGTWFLTQLHNDLSALLDAQLTKRGDDPTITEKLTSQILARLNPAVGKPGERATTLLVIWLDPVSIDLVDPQGSRAVYDLQKNTVKNDIARTFVEVGSNVEVLVVASATGLFNLTIGDVPESARGGAVVLGATKTVSVALTDAIRSGTRNFQFDLSELQTSAVNLVSGGGDSGGGVSQTAALSTLITVLAYGLGSSTTALEQLDGPDADGDGGGSGGLTGGAGGRLAQSGGGAARDEEDLLQRLIAVVDEVFRRWADDDVARLPLGEATVRALGLLGSALGSVADAAGLDDMAWPDLHLAAVGRSVANVLQWTGDSAWKVVQPTGWTRPVNGTGQTGAGNGTGNAATPAVPSSVPPQEEEESAPETADESGSWGRATSVLGTAMVVSALHHFGWRTTNGRPPAVERPRKQR